MRSTTETIRRLRLPAVLSWLFVSALTVAPALAQQPQPPETGPPATPEQIQQQQPAFFVHAEVDGSSGEFYEGEQITLNVVSEQDAYLYVLYKQADGQVYAVFPNSGQTDNRVQARQRIQIPAAGDVFRWTVGAPFGKELMKVIASKQRIAELERPEARRQRFSAVSGEALAGVVERVRQALPAESWSEVSLEIVTRGGPNPNARPPQNRYGIFFGVSAHDMTALKVAAFGDKANNDLPNCAVDAAMIASCLEKVGGLTASKAFIGKDASRKNLQSAVTEWLPSVSRQGDTVVIYFSGHGAQIPDDNGDEADELDELLIPCDAVDVDCLYARAKLVEEKKPVDAEVNRRVDEAWNALQRAGVRTINQGNYRQANGVLMRATAVSDDLFARWLQALSGRRVIVVLDSCFSGGFATQEKGLGKGESEATEAPRFDFLSGEVGRLKDIGQPDTALLTACRAAQTALSSHANSGRPEDQEPASIALTAFFEQLKVQKAADNDPMSVMSYYLLNTLLKAQEPVDVKQAGADCTRDMKNYFDSETFRARVRKINDQRRQEGMEAVELKGHEPSYVDYCRPPALLRP
ncbi:MAG TPA: DUF4384 domain-containing protein [Pirellulales bacterium]|nr:DUF4384 domain-containing protein [Pirellulales bacterium]